MSRSDWQAQLAAAYTEPLTLLEALRLCPEDLPYPLTRTPFPMRVPHSYARRMRTGDPRDPLLLQVLPLAEELRELPGFLADPVGDLAAERTPGLLHKYAGRVLLLATGACAVHCRYCFRRNFPYHEHALGRSDEIAALAHVASDPSIREVILSGGDPLTLSDERLEGLVERIRAIPHLRRLRLHTRLPVVLPARITERLVEMLRGTRLQTAIVIHANHPAELEGEVPEALALLRAAGLHLFNQAVLLRAVNDRVETQCALSERLFDLGVVPYYLHLLDRAAGTAHFEVPETEAREIHDGMRRRLPGYLVPRLVRERPGAPYKDPP